MPIIIIAFHADCVSTNTMNFLPHPSYFLSDFVTSLWINRESPRHFSHERLTALGSLFPQPRERPIVETVDNRSKQSSSWKIRKKLD